MKYLARETETEWDLCLHNVHFITLTNKKTVSQGSNCLSKERYLQKGTDFGRIKKHVHNNEKLYYSHAVSG